ncbi:MAG: hypothetical protein WDM89_04265 [Rhizomicrobium sp.]
MCTTGAALAKHHHKKPVIADVALDDFCNIYHITIGTNGLASAQDTPSCTGTYGGGLLAQTTADGDVLLLALQDPVGSPGVQMLIKFSYPLTPTGTFTIYQTTDGITFTDAYDGTYTREDDKLVHQGSKPISSVFHK